MLNETVAKKRAFFVYRANAPVGFDTTPKVLYYSHQSAREAAIRLVEKENAEFYVGRLVEIYSPELTVVAVKKTLLKP